MNLDTLKWTAMSQGELGGGPRSLSESRRGAAVKLLHGDALQMLKTLPDESVQMCCTSPPYWGLRDYGAEGQLGLERTPDEYVAKLVEIMREVRRVLAQDGTLWLNLGDSYAGSWGAQSRKGDETDQIAAAPKRTRTGSIPEGSTLKPKDLVGIPWMVAFALRADGWWLRSDIIWSKPNPMPESITDRPTKSHEYVFLLAKSERYFYDAKAVMEPATNRRSGNVKPAVRLPGEREGANDNLRGSLHKIEARVERNRRTVWTVTTSSYKGAHFATYPPKLIRPCILAGSRPGDLVLDPFNGAGTTGLVATQLRRSYVGIDVNADYLALTQARLAGVQQEIFLRGGA